MSAPTTAKSGSPGQPRPGGGSGPRPGGGSGTGPKGHTVAMAAQAVALVAVGLALIAGELTAPAAPAVEPMRMRPATEQERRDYDVRRLAEALDELRRQRTHDSGHMAGARTGIVDVRRSGPTSPARQDPETTGVSAIARPGGPG